MRIFVTGGTGFIGSHFVNRAHEMGLEMVVLRRSPASLPRVPLARDPIWIDKSMIGLDDHDLSGSSVLVHLAGAGITPQPASWEECFQVNLTNSLRLVRQALRVGVRRVVVAGTYAEYGGAGLRFDPIPVDAPLEPTDCYAASKAAAFLALAALCRSQKFEFVYGRLFSVYGPGQYEKNFWPLLHSAALAGRDFAMTKGEQVRDFVAVEQVVEMILSACIRSDVAPGEPKIENFASGHAQTLRSFAEFWWNHWKASGKLRVGDVPYRDGEIMRFVPVVAKPLPNFW